MRLKIVVVKWRDSKHYYGWHDPATQKGGYSADICQSAGFLIEKTDDHLTIAIDEAASDNLAGVGVIPAEAILEYHEIGEVESVRSQLIEAVSIVGP